LEKTLSCEKRKSLSKKKQYKQKTTTVRPATKPGKQNLNWQKWLVIFLPFLIYANTISHEYALDDAIVITENNFTQKGMAGIGDIFKNESFVGFFGRQKALVAGARYRPLSLATFAIEYEFFGLNPSVGHFMNIVYYSLTGLMLYMLFYLLLIRSDKWKPFAFILPLLATILFIVHPIHTEVVANIKGRDEIFSLLFSLTALWAMMKYLDDKKTQFILIAGASFFLAVLSKENAYTFVAIIPLTIYFFRKISLSKIFHLTLPFIVISGISIWIRYQITGFDFSPATDLMNNPFIEATGMQKSATVLFTWLKYLYLLIIPYHLTHDYYPYQIELQTFSSLPVVLSILIYAALIFFAVSGIAKKKIYSYGLLFFLITFSIVSNLVFSVGTFMAERLMFMPIVGFSFLMAWAILQIPVWLKKPVRTETINNSSLISYFNSFAKSNSIGLGIFLILFSFYSFIAIDRNKVWKNDETLFLSDIDISTNSAKMNNAAGGKLYDLSQVETDPLKQKEELQMAFVYLQKALEIYPGYQAAWTTLGNVYYFLNKDYQNAIACYFKAGDLPSFENLLNIARRAYNEKDYPNAILCFQNYVQALPDRIEGYLELAQAYIDAGQVGESIRILEEALKKFNESEDIYIKLGLAYGKGRNDFQNAIGYFEKALQINPKNVSTLENLGVAYGFLNRPEQSIYYFESALQIDPSNASLHRNLGNAYMQQGNTEKAMQQFQMAESLSNK
jgi:protein O-mannosyl-transferase